MRASILVLGLLSLGVIGAEKPIERGSEYVDNQEAAQAAVQVVEYFGYRCDSISSFHKGVFSDDFTLKCNNFRYVYTIKDKGGRWVVDVE